MGHSHVRHFIQREKMRVLVENRKHPRMGVIRREKSNDIFALRRHVNNWPLGPLAGYLAPSDAGAKTAVIVVLLMTSTEFVLFVLP